MTLQEQIDRVLELDAKRTQGEWDSDGEYISTSIPWKTGVDCHGRPYKNDFIAEVEYDGLSTTTRDTSTNDAYFIAFAPQMAAIIRKQSEMLKVAKEGLSSTLSENDDREININNCNREGVYYLNNGYLELILGIEQALATIEEMEKL